MNSELNILVYYPRYTDRYRKLLSKKIDGANFLVCDSKEDIDQQIASADILLVSIQFPVSYIKKARNLKWVQVLGAGVDHFTMETKIPENVTLTRVNRGFGDKIAEYVFAYILLITQRVAEVLDNQKRRSWKPLRLTWLKGQTIGVAGLGPIGNEVARKAKCLGMKVLGLARTVKDLEYIERCYFPEDLPEFLNQLRFLVICLPLTKRTREMFGIKEFKAMRQDAYLINVARGRLVKERDLIKALKERTIKGAVLDVFSVEPLPKNSPLWGMKNAIITPHHSGPSLPEEMVNFFLENLERYCVGKKLMGVVNLKHGY